MLNIRTLMTLLIGPFTAVSQTASCHVAVDSLKGTWEGCVKF